MSAQNEYAIMEWPTDNNKLSIHQLKLIKEPVKSWNDYRIGEEGLAAYPGFKELWKFKILAVGATRKALEKPFNELIAKRGHGTAALGKNNEQAVNKENVREQTKKDKNKEQPEKMKDQSKREKRKITTVENKKLPVKKRKAKHTDQDCSE